MKRFICLVLSLALLMMFASGASASAASVPSLKKNQWFTLSNSTNDIYKLKVNVDTILTCSWKGADGQVWCTLYADPERETRMGDFYDSSARGSQGLALSKGVYYVEVFQMGRSGNAKVKFTVQRAVNKKNYCRTKALALAARKTVKIAQTVDHCYDRWYKITLKEKKKVTIKTNSTMHVGFYDAKLREIECTKTATTFVTQSKLSKGDYFILVTGVPENVNTLGGEYITISWK